MTQHQAPSKEEVLNLYYSLFKFTPINWKDRESVKQFRLASNDYAKLYNKLDYADQGWISEQLNMGDRNV